MRFTKIIFISIIIFILYLLFDYVNHKKSNKITERMSNGIQNNQINRRVSFADEKNQPLETFIKLQNNLKKARKIY